MKKIFSVLYVDNDLDDLVNIQEYDVPNFDYTEFWEGKPFNDILPKNFKLFIGGEYGVWQDSLNNPLSLQIFSVKLINLIDKFSSDFEVYDAPIYTLNNKKSLSGYYILNAIHNIDCIDYEKSKIMDDGYGGIDITSNIVFDTQKIPDDINIFRIKKLLHTGIYFTQKVVDAISEKGILGIGLRQESN